MQAVPLRETRRFVFKTASGAFLLLAGVVFINDNVAEVTFITGQSMSPCLSPYYDATGQRDCVLWKKWNPMRNLQSGDLVFFRSPSRPDDCAVKRVIATEGDTVLLDPRRRPCRERDGADLPESRGWDALRGRVQQVPEGHVWVEGDNWRKTWDSNAYGPISTSLIIGKAVAVLSPWDRFWTKPWEGFRGGTKVIPGVISKKMRDAEVEGVIKAIETG